MTTVERDSLLTLPSEMRLRVYRYLFEDKFLSLDLMRQHSKGKSAEDYMEISGDDMIDSGITLTCRLVRNEAMPELLQAVNLYCWIGSGFRGPGTFPIKEVYTRFVKKLHVEFETEGWTLPFQQLPYLEEVFIESSGDCEAINLGGPFAETIQEWAEDQDIDSFIKIVKSEARFTTGDWGANNILDNKDRGFRIKWRDWVRIMDAETCMCIMYDWDTLEVLQGLEDILREFADVRFENESAEAEPEDGGGA